MVACGCPTRKQYIHSRLQEKVKCCTLPNSFSGIVHVVAGTSSCLLICLFNDSSGNARRSTFLSQSGRPYCDKHHTNSSKYTPRRFKVIQSILRVKIKSTKIISSKFKICERLNVKLAALPWFHL